MRPGRELGANMAAQIDWNQVAQDPVLLQPITNGHAARMRYSRFRSTVTGHEPQKRGRPGDKDRVAKAKKEHGARKGDVMVKSESGVSLSSLPQVRCPHRTVMVVI